MLDGGVGECERESECEGDRDARDGNKVVASRHVHDDVGEECCATESVENTTPVRATPLLFSESAILRARVDAVSNDGCV